MLKITLIVIILFLILPVTSVTAQSSSNYEKTFQFNTVVEIQPDSKLKITEEIEVQSLGISIKRGIFRDYPTKYVTPEGYSREITLTFLTATKDAKKEPFRVENITNGKRIYLGDPNVFLSPGKYKYVLTYEVTGLVGFFDEFDELYYNVLPGSWPFEVDSTNSKVIFPTVIDHEKIQYEAYLGSFGSKNTQDVSLKIEEENGKTVIYITNLKSLAKNEGLTLLTHFPKGILSEPIPTLNEWAIKYSAQNYILILGFIFLILLTTILYNLFGKDPLAKIPYPRFDLKSEITPLYARSLLKETFDYKGLTSEIVYMGINGLLKIEQERSTNIFGEDKFTITETEGENEKKKNSPFFLDIFMFGKVMTFKKSNFEKIQSIVTTIKSKIDEYLGNYIFPNTFLKITVSLMILIIIFLASIFPTRQSSVFEYYLGGVIISYLTGFIAYKLFVRFNTTYKTYQPINSSIFTFVLLILIGINIAYPINLINSGINVTYIEIFVVELGGLILGFIIQTLKNYSKEGLELINYVKGLEIFITATESERIKVMGTLYVKDLSTFNKFYPYAIAFDAEDQWTNDFKEVIRKAMNEYKSNNSNSVPNYWFNMGNDLTSLSSSLSTLGDSIASTLKTSSTDPTTSSHSFSSGGGGGGGGGSSGGGGGGGGGGGW